MHPLAVIGRRVELMHGVTLGSMRYADSPVIGEYVRIGPNAIVLGNVTIGAGARIGGGCVITKDVEPNTLVVGAETRRVLPFEPAGPPEGQWDPATWWEVSSAHHAQSSPNEPGRQQGGEDVGGETRGLGRQEDKRTRPIGDLDGPLPSPRTRARNFRRRRALWTRSPRSVSRSNEPRPSVKRRPRSD